MDHANSFDSTVGILNRQQTSSFQQPQLDERRVSLIGGASFVRAMELDEADDL